jgi:hypothetical protein
LTLTAAIFATIGYIFETDGKYYGVKSLSDGAAKADEFVFTK